ncbi:Cell wall alpha-1,3-glucan synthase ags1 [Puccinia graminis f. sp. tritici]|uniref:Cell wall alpha-1,3-glucan synthase ags1 n=1 Tax=Puccinia graminis f. sp. tritici TaxID=56615 RepID=A0A5B0M7K7_PUCGR|nr:Cell wall alpha-1,3-glucan synthase ags1 [Puccinia graminis f. sp. tritici]
MDFGSLSGSTNGAKSDLPIRDLQFGRVQVALLSRRESSIQRLFCNPLQWMLWASKFLSPRITGWHLYPSLFTSLPATNARILSRSDTDSNPIAISLSFSDEMSCQSVSESLSLAYVIDPAFKPPTPPQRQFRNLYLYPTSPELYFVGSSGCLDMVQPD